MQIRRLVETLTHGKKDIRILSLSQKFLSQFFQLFTFAFNFSLSPSLFLLTHVDILPSHQIALETFLLLHRIFNVLEKNIKTRARLDFVATCALRRNIICYSS